MDPGIGAPSGNGPGGPLGIQRRQGCFQGFLDAGVAGLALPAAIGRPVVLQAEGDAAQGSQTSSMIAISALSPRRGTVRMMRV